MEAEANRALLLLVAYTRLIPQNNHFGCIYTAHVQTDDGVSAGGAAFDS